jgi:hypothetical protein
MTNSKAALLSNAQQIVKNKNTFWDASQEMMTQFHATADLTKGRIAIAFARVHRLYLKDEIMYASQAPATPSTPKKSTKKKA